MPIEIYPGGDHQFSPNLHLGLWGTDEVTTDNFLLIDAAFGGIGAIEVNGVTVPPPANFINSPSVTFGVVGSNISLTAASSGGTVTSFSAGNLDSIATTSVATPTTTPALTFSLSTQTANSVFAGPTSGGAATPTFRLLVAADIPQGITNTSLAVHQVAHGFTVGQAVYFTGTVWALAEANAIGTLGLGLVIIVPGPDDFTVCFEGFVKGLSGLTAGQYYFVSDATPGLLTVTEPVATSSFSNPLLFAISTTAGTVISCRPSAISSMLTSPTVVIVTGNANAAVGQFIFANTSTGGFTVTLPASSVSTGQIITIKKVSMDGNSIVIAPTGSDKIDLQTSQSFSSGLTSVTVVADGAGNWFII